MTDTPVVLPPRLVQAIVLALRADAPPPCTGTVRERLMTRVMQEGRPASLPRDHESSFHGVRHA